MPKDIKSILKKYLTERRHIIWELIKNTIQKEYHNRTLIFLALATLFIIYVEHKTMGFFGKGMGGPLSIASSMSANLNLISLKLNLFYIIISSWSGLMGAILGTNAVKSDIRMQVLPQILAWPISRGEYLIARIIGTTIIVLAYYLISIFFAALLFYSSSGEGTTALPILINILQSILYSSLAVLVIVTWGILVSLFLPKIWSVISVLVIMGIVGFSNEHFKDVAVFSFLGNSSGTLEVGAWSDKLQSIYDYIQLLIHYLLPRLGVINSIAKSSLQSESAKLVLWPEWIHFIFSYLLLVLVVLKIFKKKDIV